MHKVFRAASLGSDCRVGMIPVDCVYTVWTCGDDGSIVMTVWDPKTALQPGYAELGHTFTMNASSTTYSSGVAAIPTLAPGN